MRKNVTAQHRDPTYSLDEFTGELNKFIETKGLETQYRAFTIPAKKTYPSVNAVSAKDKKEIEAGCKKIKTRANLERDTKMREEKMK